MRKMIWLTIFCLAASINAFGQAREITRGEYYKAYREAFQKFNAASAGRSTSKDEYYKDGKFSSSTETITENIRPDKFRFVVVETSDKGKNKSDLIKIGEKYYCRKNDGQWQASTGGCIAGGGKGISNIVDSKFYIETIKENGKPARFYRQYTLHKNKDVNGREVLWYWESKFWVDEDGNFLRAEDESGLEDTNEIRSKSVTNYEYNPKDLKIEAPIKP